MLKLSHSTMTFVSGAIWMGIGVFLLQLGINLLFTPVFDINAASPLINLFKGILPHYEASIMIASVALYAGFLKGKHVLTKTAIKTVERIRSLPNPAPLTEMYGPKYLLLIAFMMGLGMCMKFFGLPNDIRGAIDIAVGSALINGAMHYLRSAVKLRQPVL